MTNQYRKVVGVAVIIVVAVAGYVGYVNYFKPASTTQPSQIVTLTGAGATFPYPLYQKWASEYEKVDNTIRVNYQSIGSGAGIRQIIERTVDFGGSDAPMTDAQLKTAPGEILHIPTVLGAVVVTYNIPGISRALHLTPDVLASIFLGEIERWNDPKLAEINPTLSLPEKDIALVHRSDGSGTTNIFTDYLSKVDQRWATKVGMGTSVNWPVGIGAKGNEGVSGQVKQTPYSIGYVELTYAIQNNLPCALLRNQAGKFIEPTLESTTAAAAGIIQSIPADMRVSIVNALGDNAYPIAGFTYLLVYKGQDELNRGKALARFLWWAIHDGQRHAPSLLYAPLPSQVVALAETKIKSMNFHGQPLL